MLVTASMGLYLVLADRGLAQNRNDRGTKPGIPNGTYVIRITGQIPDPSGSGKLVPLAAARRRTYFANGTTSGTVSASINGQIATPITVKGTFTTNGDGSFSETETQTTFPFQTLHFILYVTADGNSDTAGSNVIPLALRVSIEIWSKTKSGLASRKADHKNLSLGRG